MKKPFTLTETISQASAEAFIKYHQNQHSGTSGLKPTTPDVELAIGESQYPECVSLTVEMDAATEEYTRLIDTLFIFLAGMVAGRHQANMEHIQRSVVIV